MAVKVQWCGLMVWVLVAKESVFDSSHWTTLVGLIKNRRAVADFLSAPGFSTELTEITDLYNAEVKASFILHTFLISKFTISHMSGTQEARQEVIQGC